MTGRWVVVLSRTDAIFDGDENVVIGPFRSIQRANRRADTIRRLAYTYEDPEGVTGEANALDVIVTPIQRGTLSARDALDTLYDTNGGT